MRVSLADVQVLQQAAQQMASYLESLESCCHAEEQRMQELEQDVSDYIEICDQELQAAEEAVEQAKEEYDAAQQAYNRAAQNARSASSSSSSPDGKDESGDEESAEEELEEAAEDLEAAAEKLETQRENLRALQDKANQIKELEEAIQSRRQDMQARHASLLSTQETVRQGCIILERKYAAMEGYMNSPAVQAASNWLFTPPPQGSLVTPAQLNERLNQPPPVRLEIARYLRDSTPSFGRVIDNLAEKMHYASTPQEQWAAMRQVRATGTGTLAELMAQRGLSCYAGSTETQSRTHFEGGRYTKTDLILKDLHAPVILGKGKGMMAPAGGSIGLEIKCGCKEYLKQQQNHMVFQAGGHKQCDASFTLTSRDILKLSPEEQKELRDALRDAGSPIVGMLPEKAEMDATCMKLVEERMEDLYGKSSD